MSKITKEELQQIISFKKEVSARKGKWLSSPCCYLCGKTVHVYEDKKDSENRLICAETSSGKIVKNTDSGGNGFFCVKLVTKQVWHDFLEENAYNNCAHDASFAKKCLEFCGVNI